LIIEKASGASYRDFIHKRILEPLNLGDTCVPSDEAIPGNYAHGYIDTTEDGKLKDVTDLHPSVVWSAGSMVSTTKDLARWAKAIYGGELLSDDSMRKMFSFVDIGYEDIKYGLGVYKYQDGIVGHDGDFVGYSSQVVYVIDSKLTIVVLTNRLPPRATEIAIEVLQLLSEETS
jgi:D-alanyl-D-alanine carboxypeptidase